MKVAGTAVVMKNGNSLTKTYADIIIDSNENDGLAKFIEEEYLKD